VPEYLAPGVYVEETSFRAKSIEGVGTSTTAFAGPTRKGPVAGADNLPEILTSYADFERIYGGFADLQLAVASAADARPINYLAHAVRAYFNEGGSRLYVARVYLANGGAAGTTSCGVTWTRFPRPGAAIPRPYPVPIDEVAGVEERFRHVDLPTGAVVTKVRMFVLDEVAQDIQLWLFRVKPALGSPVQLAQLASSGAKSKLRTFTATPIVDTATTEAQRVYFQLIMSEPSHVLYGADVSYVINP
jgi:hypothetical protein